MGVWLLAQDLNAVETAWRELRARLNETMPTGRELRSEFLARLRRAVAWVNTHRCDLFKELCTNQKERAREVVAAKGGRTKYRGRVCVRAAGRHPRRRKGRCAAREE